jgi:hypothetical protein
MSFPAWGAPEGPLPRRQPGSVVVGSNKSPFVERSAQNLPYEADLAVGERGGAVPIDCDCT